MVDSRSVKILRLQSGVSQKKRRMCRIMRTRRICQRTLVAAMNTLRDLPTKRTWRAGRGCFHRQHNRFGLRASCDILHLYGGQVNENTRWNGQYRVAPPGLTMIGLVRVDHQNAERAHVPPFLTTYRGSSKVAVQRGGLCAQRHPSVIPLSCCSLPRTAGVRAASCAARTANRCSAVRTSGGSITTSGQSIPTSSWASRSRPSGW